MNESHGVSPGEWGGMFAGVIALLAALGKGAAWLLSWRERAAVSREAKLQLWHDELTAREHRVDQQIEDRLASLEVGNRLMIRQQSVLRLAFEIVGAELRAKDPGNPALRRAEMLLNSAFPVDPTIPPDMAATLGAID